MGNIYSLFHKGDCVWTGTLEECFVICKYEGWIGVNIDFSTHYINVNKEE